MTGLQHGRPVGRCQPIARLGDYCAPGDRRRRILGYSVYTFSCPCDTGLICRAAKFTQLPSRMGAFFDPQCVPEDFPGYATARPLVNNNLPPDYVTRQPDTVDLDLGVTVVWPGPGGHGGATLTWRSSWCDLDWFCSGMSMWPLIWLGLMFAGFNCVLLRKMPRNNFSWFCVNVVLLWRRGRLTWWWWLLFDWKNYRLHVSCISV